METKKTKSKNCVIIDPVKLKNELKKRHLTMSVASRQIGLSSSYLSQMCRSGGKLPTTVLLALTNEYNIQQKDIIKSEQVQPKSNSEFDINNSQLFHIIYKATLKAMKEALNN